ncbi:MAG: L,D-transpeptidase family protein [Halorhodospira sp.]
MTEPSDDDAQALEGDASEAEVESPGQDRQVNRYPLQAGVDIVGEAQKVRASAEDTLLDIAQRYAVGYEQIRMANQGVDTWLPGEGTEVRIPSRYILPDAPREGVVINLAEMRLYHYPEGEDEGVVEIFPVSIGRMDWSTPLGETRITGKIENPAWYPPTSIREQAAERGEELPQKVPPGPDNPLGRHALLLDISGYLLHGTNRPWGIGMRATHGCIRLHPHDIAYLYEQLEVGTPVRIVNQPFKAGWSRDGLLHLQAFPFFEEEERPNRKERIGMAVEAVASALGGKAHRIDGSQVRAAAERQRGEVVRISRDDAKPLEVARPD